MPRSSRSGGAAKLGHDARALEMDVQGDNQALPAMLYRFCGPRAGLPPCELPPQLVELAPASLWTLYALAALAIYGLTLLACRRAAPALPTALDAALIVLAMHLISKKTWEYHLVTLLFVDTLVLALALKRAAVSGRSLPSGGGPALAALAAATVCKNAYSPLFVGRSLSAAFKPYRRRPGRSCSSGVR